MADHGMPFSAPMIRALLDGRKTQTRRVLKMPDWTQHYQCTGRLYTYERQPGREKHGLEFVDPDWDLWHPEINPNGRSGTYLRVPIMAGDRVWVRETWNAFSFSQDGDEAWPTKTIPTAEEMQEIRELAHRVDVQAVYAESDRARKWFSDQKWRPSIHMPRWASRITLCITDVRVQRLQEISYKDILAEGIEATDIYARRVADCVERHIGCGREGRGSFEELWTTLHGPDAWDANPFVYALTFTVHAQNIDQMPEVAA